MKPEQLQSMQKGWSATNQAGFSLVEVILSSALFALLVTAFVGAYLYGQEATALAGDRARATVFAEDGLEAVRNIRDAGFTLLSNGTYGLVRTGNQWNLSGSSDSTDIFTRQIVISSSDLKKKSVTSNVTWQQNTERSGTVSLQTNLTSWNSNWNRPLQTRSLDLVGTDDVSKVQISGNYAYVIRGGATNNFLVIDVTFPETPILLGTLTLAGVPQNIFVSGNYAYVVNNDLNQELQIINISNPASPSLAGSYNAPGSADGLGIFVVGTTAFMTLALSSGSEFAVLNVANPATPTLIGSLELNANGNDVVVSGSYAYVATSDNAQELKVVNISVPTAPTLAGFLDMSGSTDASTIAIAGSVVFIARGAILSTVNVSTPSAPALLGSITLSGNISDIALNLNNANTYVFLATQDNANEFKVVNVTNLTTPVLYGQMNVAGLNWLYGVAYDPTIDRAFVVGQSNTEEFIVIEPH